MPEEHIIGLQLVALSIYDTKAESYTPPVFARTVGEGLRQFKYVLEDPQTTYSKSPGDFRLFRVGVFDVTTGVLRGSEAGPVLVEDGLALVKEA